MLTIHQAYVVMYQLLDTVWKQSNYQYDDDFAVLLGAMAPMKNGMPMDAAIWEAWKDAIGKREKVSLEDGFHGMIVFLKNYRAIGETETQEITRVINELESSIGNYKDIWRKLSQEEVSDCDLES
jgi:hypothetical protein